MSAKIWGMACLIATGLIGVAAHSQAGEFKVINRSNDRIFVATHISGFSSGGGLSGEYSFGVDEGFSYWKTRGWFIVDPGQIKAIYNGNLDRIYVRMSRNSGFGPVVRPLKHHGSVNKLVHRKRFMIKRVDSNGPERRYYLDIGSGPSRAEFWGSDTTAEEVCVPVSGFYFLDSNTHFTVR